MADKNLVEVIRCKDCIYWKPPRILLNDGTERLYAESDKDIFGLHLVTMDIGINIGGQCFKDTNCGYDGDKTVFRKADDYCNYAKGAD